MNYKDKKYDRLFPRKSRRKWLAFSSAILIVCVLLVLGAYWQFGRHRQTARPVTAGTSTKGIPATNTNKPSQSSNSTSSDTGSQPSGNPSVSTNQNAKQSQTTPTPASTTPPQIPQGNFVSSHHASSGTAEQSTCTTTPGATCAITFTDGATTKSLTPETTDRGGTAYWSWTPASIGLTAGNWSIQAVATLGGQTQNANDAMQLQVTP